MTTAWIDIRVKDTNPKLSRVLGPGRIDLRRHERLIDMNL